MLNIIFNVYRVFIYKILHIHEGLAGVQVSNELYGFIDKSGREVIPCEYQDIGDFSEGLAKVEDVFEEYGFIDKNGNKVIPCEYESVGDFHEGLAGVKDYNGWGFIDKSGNEVIPCKYYGTHDFHEGLAGVQVSNLLWGFINKSGREVVPCKYYDVLNFNEGIAKVRVKDKQEICGVDNNGRTLTRVKPIFKYVDKNGIEVSIDDLNRVNESVKNKTKILNEFNSFLTRMNKVFI